MTLPRPLDCPQCHTLATSDAKRTDGTYQCPSCGCWYDSDPDEGGTHDDRDPSRRLSRQEKIDAAQRAQRPLYLKSKVRRR